MLDVPRSIARPLPRARSQRFEREWYGWQTLALDSLSLSLLVAGLRKDHEALLWVGGASYLFGGPLIHAGHHNWTAGASLVTRALLPLLGTLIGSAYDNCEPAHDCVQLGELAGFAGGALAAVVLDASAFSWTPRQKPTESESALTLTLAPTLGDSRRGLSLFGTF